MSHPQTTSDAIVAEARALADAGAQGAASAMADLTKRAVEVCAPTRVEGDAAPGMKVAAAIFFELLGGARGELAVLLSEEICRELVSILLGGSAPLPSEDASSALSEMGNVLASHAATGVAERVGESVLPTPPDLVLGAPRDALRARQTTNGGSLRLETMLRDESGASICALIWTLSHPESAQA